jgi:hypothetical protein
MVAFLTFRYVIQRLMNFEIVKYVYLTAEEQWDPYGDTSAQAEKVFDHHREVYATSSHDHQSSVTPDELAQRWGTSICILTKTFKVTTQCGLRNLLSPLSRRFCTRQAHTQH